MFVQSWCRLRQDKHNSTNDFIHRAKRYTKETNTTTEEETKRTNPQPPSRSRPFLFVCMNAGLTQPPPRIHGQNTLRPKSAAFTAFSARPCGQRKTTPWINHQTFISVVELCGLCSLLKKMFSHDLFLSADQCKINVTKSILRFSVKNYRLSHLERWFSMTLWSILSCLVGMKHKWNTSKCNHKMLLLANFHLHQYTEKQLPCTRTMHLWEEEKHGQFYLPVKCFIWTSLTHLSSKRFQLTF